MDYLFVIVQELAELKCQGCQGFIEIHQPNPIQPERILGTCPDCGLWYLIESREDVDQVMVLRLPAFTEIPCPDVGDPPR